MEWDEVLDPELSPREVLCERIPRLHRARLEQFQRLVDTTLTVSFVFTDVDEQYTVKLRPDGVEAVSGDMIDFPQATVRGQAAKWQRAIELASRLVKPADDQIDEVEGRVKVTDEIRRGFEQFDGVLEVELKELPDGGEPLRFEVILNDYTEPSWAERAKLEVRWPILVELANGRVGPVEAARKVTVRGAMGPAFDVGGYFVTQFDL